MKQKDDFIFGVQYYRAPTPRRKIGKMIYEI